MEITEDEVQTALKRMKKGRAPGIDEVCTEIMIAAEVRVSWTKRLFNVCMRGGSILINCADMEGEGRCSICREVQGYYAPKSCYEGAGEDAGWEDKEECGDGDQRGAAGWMFVLSHPSIHPSGPDSVQSVGAASAVSLAIGHNPGWVATLTQVLRQLVEKRLEVQGEMTL